MKRKIQLAYILLMASAVYSVDHEYCFLDSCPNRTHTLCLFTQIGAHDRCGEPLRFGLEGDEIQTLVNFYNNHRPREYWIQWDIELADIAQRWAYQCVNDRDLCRHVERFRVRQHVGQQWAHISQQRPSIYPLISHWLAEDSLMSLNFESLSIHDNSNAQSRYRNRFMQIGDKVGCGAVRSFDNRFQYLQLVCNFGPD